MTLYQHQADHQRCLQMASEMLGATARALDLDWRLEQILRRHLRLEARRGIGAEDALLKFHAGRRGHRLKVGLERFRLDTNRGSLRIVKVVAPRTFDVMDVCYDFWAVAAHEYQRLYRFLRREVRREQAHAAPIMREADRTRLWDNTVGFLRRGCELLGRYGVRQKRGVLLLGKPGNGKTMACRWLRGQCHRYGLDWRSVSAEEYEDARDDARAHELFQLSRPGIVFFDDVDMALRDRERFGENRDQSTFLAELDGLDLHHGVVYLFTSNARLADLDPAFRRPGRIDLVLSFPRPDPELRRKLIERSWHSDIVAAIPVQQVVEQTEGLSFAELEEVKKLLVLRYLNAGQWDWKWAWESYRSGSGAGKPHCKIGFARNGHSFPTRAVANKS